MEGREKENRTGISRRDFLRGAAIGTAGVAMTGVLGACAPVATQSPVAETPAGDPVPSGKLPWLGKEPEIADANVEETTTVDVIVIGAGVAGVAATRSASEEGAAVAVFEKGKGPQCRSGEYAVINGKLQARWGRDNMDPDELVDSHMKESSYKVKRSIMSRWAKGSAEVFDWFIAAKPDIYICDTSRSDVPDEHKDAFLAPLLHPLPEHYNYKEEQFPTFPTSVILSPSQAPVVNANMDKAISTGKVKPYYGHFVEKLIMENGRCTGVYARNAQTGKYVKAIANKGVILATGEYSSNDEILNYYCPEVLENNIPRIWVNIDVEGNKTNTGDGLKLGAWAGAKIQQHHAPMIHHMGGEADIEGIGVMGIAGFLQLDANGKRFMNEDVPGQQVENQIELLKGQYSYQFWDAKWKDEIQYMPAAHGTPCYYDESTPKNNATSANHKSQAQLDKAVADGRCIKADTLEELLSKLEIDQATALKSIQRYNELCHKGKDEDFGKVAKRLFPLEAAPFYAVKMTTAALLVCIGGLESDEECHTFDEDRNVIPGLYAAGNVQGNRYGVEYPISLKGVSHATALFYGYIAGKNAVKQI
ncbi:succinate dehydrogenase/fumarate reductase flavoprotein subunit [Desulfitobacterium sp. LBE]|uniref:FAD-dependent oxidoreductase n=1 Tax=Desulfitobacterium sp. LBE TaxID=884086 RepID=UPI00119A3599|nr:FAD-dependent oxidoreductase [Desulfitobacterium sp. LBE]TWH56908.1 succinate dehydrogenase/fumarate reductase flavoprotein subunit [Desulfitobacterium sp. LBE]